MACLSAKERICGATWPWSYQKWRFRFHSSSSDRIQSTFCPETIMLSRTLLSTLRCPVQFGTRTHLTAAWGTKPPSLVLKMLSPSRSWNATHRGWTSRGRSSFNAPRPPRFRFWQQISQRINRLPSDLIFWGIFGINGAVFLLWQVANTQWVSHRSPPHTSL